MLWQKKDFESYTQSNWELIKAVKQLTDENLDDVKILTRANEIANAMKRAKDDGWAAEYAKPIDQFIEYGKKKFGK